MSSRFVSICVMRLLQSAMLADKYEVTHFLIHKVRRNSHPQSQIDYLPLIIVLALMLHCRKGAQIA